MEKLKDHRDQNTLINQLKQGKDLANQLRNHLEPSSTSHQSRLSLIENILSSYDNALSLLNWGSTPTSEASDQLDSKKINTHFLKKRKVLPSWSQQVKVCSGTGSEGPLDDGYRWRKYGQKDILGATFPRGYYRCTHRHVQGCLATKQVQRSDQGPSIFEITYRGRHTCTQSSHLANKVSFSVHNQVLKETNDQRKQQDQTQKQRHDQMWGSGLKVKPDTNYMDDIFPSFGFSSSSIGSEIGEENVFAEAMIENDLVCLSPMLMSPTSEFYFSTCHVSSFNELAYNLQTSESELNSSTDIISASATNSPIFHLDFTLDKVDFSQNYKFDNSEFFS